MFLYITFLYFRYTFLLLFPSRDVLSTLLTFLPFPFIADSNEIAFIVRLAKSVFPYLFPYLLFVGEAYFIFPEG